MQHITSMWKDAVKWQANVLSRWIKVYIIYIVRQESYL